MPTPNKVKEKGVNSQTKFVIKAHYIGCYLPYKASHNAQFSLYGFLTTKKISLNTSFSSRIRQLVSHCKNPAAVGQHIWTPFPSVPIFHSGNILKEPFAMFIGDGSHVFRGKKILNGTATNTVSMPRDSPQHCMLKLALAQFHCDFPLLHCLESFCKRFQMPYRLFLL
jgi:hypothetical protein